MKSPEEIIKDITSKREEDKKQGEGKKHLEGLFFEQNKAQAEMLGTVLGEVKKHKFKVSIENLPEVQKVEGDLKVTGIDQLQTSIDKLASVKEREVDFSPVIKAVKEIKLPKINIPEQLKEVSINNLKELKKPLDEIAKKLNTQFPEVKIPEFPKTLTVSNLGKVEELLEQLTTEINKVSAKEPEKTDIEPLISAVNEVKNSILNLHFPIPNLNIPKTPSGHVPVEIVGDATVTGTVTANPTSYATKVTVSGTTTYVAKAAAGSAQSSAVWQAMKVDESSGVVITWADGNTNFDNVATDLTALTYS